MFRREGEPGLREYRERENRRGATSACLLSHLWKGNSTGGEWPQKCKPENQNKNLLHPPPHTSNGKGLAGWHTRPGGRARAAIRIGIDGK